jgi:hypothetical protein
MWFFALSASAATLDDSWFTAERCAAPGCDAVFGTGATWTVGSQQPGREGQVVRLDARIDGALVSVWMRVSGDKIVEHRDGAPGDLLAEGQPPVVAGWVGSALKALRSGAAASACTPAFVKTEHDSCGRLAEESGREGVTLRPIATHARGERHVAVVDWLVGGVVRDRVWLYAVGSADKALLDGVDESSRHAAAFLDGELPATATPARNPALEAWGAGFVEAPDPSTRVPRGSEVVGSGAIGDHGALCLDTPAGGMVVTVEAMGAGWRVVRSTYKAACKLTVADLLR